MLPEAANDKTQKAFWTFLKADLKPMSMGIKLDDWFKLFSNLPNPEQDNTILNEHTDQEDSLVEKEKHDRPITETVILYVIEILRRESPPVYPVF